MGGVCARVVLFGSNERIDQPKQGSKVEGVATFCCLCPLGAAAHTWCSVGPSSARTLTMLPWDHNGPEIRICGKSTR